METRAPRRSRLTDPFLVRTDVLALFVLFAGPITLLQLVEVDVLAVSLLAIPGYVSLSMLAALFTLVGIDGFSGTGLFWVHGPDLPEETMEMLAERRAEKEDLIERALRRAEFREIGPWTVGVTYGRCSQNEVAEGMREEGADASVIVKPSGPASIRGTEAFQLAHEVAGKVNGGGHPKAAGCKPDVYDDMLDYAHHWTTQGAVCKQAILDAFREMAEAVDDEATTSSAEE